MRDKNDDKDNKSRTDIENDAEDAPADPFDPERLRLTQDFAAHLEVKKELVTVPVRRPTRQEFVRVHPDERYRLQTAVLELKDDRETYLIDPPLRSALAGEIVFKALFTAITRQGVLFLWPIRLPGDDGRIDPWNAVALEAAQLATTRWVRLAANRSLGTYDVMTATAELSEPEWPHAPFRKLLEIAFRDRFITSLDHPVLRRLRGEI